MASLASNINQRMPSMNWKESLSGGYKSLSFSVLKELVVSPSVGLEYDYMIFDISNTCWKASFFVKSDMAIFS
jgi:hypothetical protein